MLMCCPGGRVCEGHSRSGHDAAVAEYPSSQFCLPTHEPPRFLRVFGWFSRMAGDLLRATGASTRSESTSGPEGLETAYRRAQLFGPGVREPASTSTNEVPGRCVSRAIAERHQALILGLDRKDEPGHGPHLAAIRQQNEVISWPSKVESDPEREGRSSSSSR